MRLSDCLARNVLLHGLRLHSPAVVVSRSLKQSPFVSELVVRVFVRRVLVLQHRGHKRLAVESCQTSVRNLNVGSARPQFFLVRSCRAEHELFARSSLLLLGTRLARIRAKPYPGHFEVGSGCSPKKAFVFSSDLGVGCAARRIDALVAHDVVLV